MDGNDGHGSDIIMLDDDDDDGDNNNNNFNNKNDNDDGFDQFEPQMKPPLPAVSPDPCTDSGGQYRNNDSDDVVIIEEADKEKGDEACVSRFESDKQANFAKTIIHHGESPNVKLIDTPDRQKLTIRESNTCRFFMHTGVPNTTKRTSHKNVYTARPEAVLNKNKDENMQPPPSTSQIKDPLTDFQYRRLGRLLQCDDIAEDESQFATKSVVQGKNAALSNTECPKTACDSSKQRQKTSSIEKPRSKVLSSGKENRVSKHLVAQKRKQIREIGVESRKRASGKYSEKEVTILLDAKAVQSDVGLAIMELLNEKSILYNVGEKRFDCTWLVLQWKWHQPKMNQESGASAHAIKTSDILASEKSEVMVPYVMFVISAKTALDTLYSGKGLESFVEYAQKNFPDSTISLLMIGVDSASLRSRERKEFNKNASGTPFRASRFQAELANLCVNHNYMRHHIVGEKTSAADYVYHTTINIGKYPYHSETKCEIYGGVQLTSTAQMRSVWVRMLCRIPGVSEKQAVAISQMYGNILKLTEAIELSGPACISDIQMENDRRVGPACAKKICTVLQATDGKTLCR